jgi:hypothetical protein
VITASKGSTTCLGNMHEPLPTKWIILRRAPLFRLLGGVYRALLSNGLFQIVPETCFNKSLSGNGLFRHNIIYIFKFVHGDGCSMFFRNVDNQSILVMLFYS